MIFVPTAGMSMRVRNSCRRILGIKAGRVMILKAA
jgi:hypothetical protein